MNCGLYGQYAIKPDSTGWPAFYQGDRTLLVKQVEEIFDSWRNLHGSPPSLTLHQIYDIGRTRYGWNFGCTWDGIYAVVERAVRATDAVPTWTMRE